MKICQAQLNLTVGDLDRNTEIIIAGIEEATKRDADLVSFPELAITGYPPEDLVYNERFVSDNLRCLDRIAKATGDVVVVVGFIDKTNGGLLNSGAIMFGGEIVGRQPKKCLPNYSVFDERRYFQEATSFNLFMVRGITVGVTVCEDVWAESGPLELLAANGVEVVVNLNASPYYAGKRDLRLEVLQTQARRHGVHIVYTNLVGGQDELVFDGRSMVVSATGELLAEGQHCQVDFIESTLSVDGDREAHGDEERSHEEVGVIEISNEVRRRDRVSKLKEVQPLDTVAEDYKALTLGVRDYVEKNGFTEAVIGVSGGIDSSITAAIAVDALGAERVVGVAMPSAISSAASLDDAKALAENLGIRFVELQISDILERYLSALEEEFRGLPADVAEENLQARIRANLLMALSNKFGWLVLATGNKSELAVGYTTLYGDMVGGFAVIKDVLKTRLYKMARYRNSISPVVPERVLEKPPSAELREGQKDEDDLPPYEILDGILELYIEEDQSTEEIVAAGFKAGLVADIVRRVEKAEYKRRQGPVGVKISRKAFGRDRRLPITNLYRY